MVARQSIIYFVQGTLPDNLDIWRIRPAEGTPERIASHNGRVTYPVLLNRRTLVYLASDSDGSGPWLYSIDVERRIPRRLTLTLGNTRSGQGLLVDWKNNLPTKHFLPIDHSLHGAEADKPEVRTVVHVHGAIVPPER